MRLICPNCDAQYEVPDDVIPLDGRDVQCSNCGITWFQASANAEADADADDAQQDYYAEPAPAPKAAPEIEPEPAPEPAPPAPPQPQRKTLDPEVANVLRQEAEREARARQAEQQTLESQPDLGLDQTGHGSEAELRAQQARDRMARLRGEDPAEQPPVHTPAAPDGKLADAAAISAATAAAGNSRREMLPDIEEINSTLRSSNEPRKPVSQEEQAAAHEPAQKKGGFGRGFVWTLLLALIAVAIYLYADQISEMVPQAKGMLDSYVAMVDKARVWLDSKILQGLQWLDTMASETYNTAPNTAQPESQ